jgi:glutathione S-transferase
MAWVLPLLGIGAPDARREEGARAALTRALAALEGTLADGRKYLVGGTATLADIVAVCQL